jgi:hypothetical protein
VAEQKIVVSAVVRPVDLRQDAASQAREPLSAALHHLAPAPVKNVGWVSDICSGLGGVIRCAARTVGARLFDLGNIAWLISSNRAIKNCADTMGDVQ